MAVTPSQSADDPTAEVTDLLQLLIRNRCVNDGTVASGEETRSVDLLAGYLAGAGDHEIYEPQPGRQSLVAKLEGSDPDAPTLMLMGHTDVVPVSPDGWTRDPFGAEVVDGFVWGRGAVDMLNLTASQAVAFRRLAHSGFKPKGTLIYLAVADEEALGRWGAEWLLDHERDAVYADYVLTESGGFQIPSAAGPRLPVLVAEKGTFWTKIRVHGTPGHGSQPYRTDNALVTAAEVVRRIAEFRPHTQIHESWRHFVAGMHYEPDITEALLDPDQFVGSPRRPAAGDRSSLARVHPHHVRADGGARRHQDQRDSRPGRPRGRHPHAARPERCRRHRDVAGSARRPCRRGRHRIERRPRDRVAHGHAFVGLIGAHQRALCEGSALVPSLMVGGTDNRFFRRAGAVGYGFGLFSKRLPYEDFATMFHGNDERVDQESLALSTQLWEAVARDLVG